MAAIAAGGVQRALIRNVRAMTARFEALLELLERSGVLKRESRDRLLGDEWGELVSEPRLDEIVRDATRVGDAEEEFF